MDMTDGVEQTGGFEPIEPFASRVKYVGWDLDGTLYPISDDFERVVLESMRLMVEKTRGEEGLRKFEAVFERTRSKTRTLTEMGFSKDDVYNEVWSKLPHQEYVKSDEKLKKEMLKLTRAGYKLFIVSNDNKREDIGIKLRLIGLEPEMFDLIIGSQDVGVHKPSPKIFNLVLEEFRADPKEVVFIGDKDSTDIEGANGVGMWTIKVGEPSVVAGSTFKDRYEVVDFLVLAKKKVGRGSIKE